MLAPYQNRYLNNMPAGCLVFGLDGTIEYVNNTLCEWLGYDRDQLVSNSIEKILNVPARIFYQTHFFPLLRIRGEAREIFLSFKEANGSVLPVMVNAKAEIENGITKYLCVVVGISERQKYEKQLLAAQKAQQKLLEENQVLNKLRAQLEASQFELERKVRIYQQHTDDLLQIGKAFMHDMQEPIRKLTFLSNALTGQNDLPATSTRMLHAIEKSAGRLGKLVSSLLGFVNVKVLEENASSLSLRDLVEFARSKVAVEMEFYELEVVVSDDLIFEGRRNAIQTVITELVRNAVKNRDLSRSLAIHVDAAIIKENAYQGSAGKYRYIDHIQIRISDNGQGFDKQYSSYVFGLLNKLDPSTDGVGLGLAMCRQLISYHYGRITADSTPGIGSTFTIQLPVSQHP